MAVQAIACAREVIQAHGAGDAERECCGETVSKDLAPMRGVMLVLGAWSEQLTRTWNCHALGRGPADRVWPGTAHDRQLPGSVRHWRAGQEAPGHDAWTHPGADSAKCLIEACPAGSSGQRRSFLLRKGARTMRSTIDTREHRQERSPRNPFCGYRSESPVPTG